MESESVSLYKRIANRVGRPFGLNPFPRAFDGPLLESRGDSATIFERIYRENFWGSGESRSGVGSEKHVARRYLKKLDQVLQNRGAMRIFDAPCGDLNWIQPLVERGDVEYLGGDIARSVIEENRARYPHLELVVFDITRDSFPRADVWHCRDCLFHLPISAGREALRRFVESGVEYALITSHRSFLMHRNLDIDFGGFRILDLERAPFNLPRPDLRIPDYHFGSEFPKFVCLWTREDVKRASERWS